MWQYPILFALFPCFKECELFACTPILRNVTPSRSTSWRGSDPRSSNWWYSFSSSLVTVRNLQQARLIGIGNAKLANFAYKSVNHRWPQKPFGWKRDLILKLEKEVDLSAFASSVLNSMPVEPYFYAGGQDFNVKWGHRMLHAWRFSVTVSRYASPHTGQSRFL